MPRKAEIRRKTQETDIAITLNLDGTGKSKIKTPVGLLNHMLELFAFHGLFDLKILAKGDARKIDIHHTNEDIGIVLGQAFKKALGEKVGITRFGDAAVPMEEVVATVTVDISGRGYYTFRAEGGIDAPLPQDGYALKDVEHFFDSFAKNLGVNLNISVKPLSEDLHTTLEPVFKALGIALDKATQIDPRRKSVPSTKGVID